MSTAFIWHLWPARNWPASATEERELVSELEHASPSSSPRLFDRGDVTIVVDMLRCGVSYAELVTYLPGVQASRLLAAYRHVERMRALSARAFASLLADPSPRNASRCAETASMLLPIPTYTVRAAIMAAAAKEISESQKDARIEQVASSVGRQGAKVLRLEKRLERQTPHALHDPARAEDAVLLGRDLYDPYDDCAWSDPFYLPARVGSVTPARLRDLFGEREL